MKKSLGLKPAILKSILFIFIFILYGISMEYQGNWISTSLFAVGLSMYLIEVFRIPGYLKDTSFLEDGKIILIGKKSLNQLKEILNVNSKS
jgi:hypothetical protein